MADPVSIVVEIIDQYSDDIAQLKGMLESLDLEEINVDVDVNDGEVMTAAAKLEALKQAADDDIDIGVNTKDLSGLGTHGDGPVGDFQRRIHGAAGTASLAEGGGRDLVGGFGDPRAQAIAPDRLDKMITPRAIKKFPIEPDFDSLTSAVTERSGPDFRTMRRGRGVLKTLAGGSGRFKRFGNVLRKYKPDIMDWWNVLAVLLPLMIALAGAAIGLAAALGGVAIAAGSIIGVGLLGWGDTMEESLSNVKREAGQLKEELFGVMQPAAGRFQPIMAQWMAGAPNQVAKLVDELEGLTVFKGGLERMGGGFMDWLEMVMATVVEMEPMITQIALRMGAAFGNLVHGVLSDMLQELYMNQEAYMDLGSAFLDIISIIFNLSKTVAFTVAQLEPLISAAQTIAEVLSGRFIVGIITTIGVLMILDGLIGSVVVALQALMANSILTSSIMGTQFVSGISSAVAALYSYIAAATSARFATAALLATATAGLGLGAFAIGQGIQAAGSMSGPRAGAPGTQRGAGGTFIEINGDVREREMDRLLDIMDSRADNEIGVSKETGEL